jgi:hypothetical protein
VSPALDGCEDPVNPDRRMESRRAGTRAVVTQCHLHLDHDGDHAQRSDDGEDDKATLEKIHLIRWCRFWWHRKPLPMEKAADLSRQRDWNI